jgi:hypothetical protein
MQRLEGRIVVPARLPCVRPLLVSLLALVVLALARPELASAQFGVASFQGSLSSAQAGAHADFSTSFVLEADALGNPDGQLRDASVALPPGLIGNPLALEKCSMEALQSLQCGPAAQVGVLGITTTRCPGVAAMLLTPAEAGATTVTVTDANAFCTEPGSDLITIGEGAAAATARVAAVVNPTTLELSEPLTSAHSAGEDVAHVATRVSESLPLFNIQPSPGHVATFATSAIVADILVQVDVGADGRLVATISEATTLLPFLGAALTLWGVPAAPSHQPLRCRELDLECGLAAPAPAAFMTNPTSCRDVPLEADLSVTSWQGQSASANAGLPSMTGCEELALAASLSVESTTSRRDASAGYEVALSLPVDEAPYGLAAPTLESVSVTLPPGTSLAPSLASALQSCEAAQLARASCPSGSRIGTAELSTPVLAEPLKGSLYMGDPTPTQRLPVYMSVSAGSVAVNVAGEVVIDEQTGRVTAQFADLPQLPLASLKLDLFNGALANPLACGPAVSEATLDSYSGASVGLSSSFEVDEGNEGGSCGAALFTPAFAAGTTNPIAGQPSPLTVSIVRPQGQQYLSSFTVKLPAGLVGLVRGVMQCGEAAAVVGACPPSSQVGSATIAAGAGPLPLLAAGDVYLTGPYAGAPLGFEIVIPSPAGAFDLGSVVVRARVEVNPRTLALTVISDPLPQALGGIALRLRSVNVTLDRPDFIVNPTNCARQTISAEVTSSEGAVADTTTPFRAAGCASLSFAPRVSASTQARATREGDGASLSLEITNGPGAQSSLRAVSATLPSTLRPRLRAIEHACKLSTLAASPRTCSPQSVVGHAVVSSPAVAGALAGAVYLLDRGAAALPSLVMALEGGGVQIELEGALELTQNGTATVTFTGLPDVPISSLAVTLPRGPHSILGAPAGLCGKRMYLNDSLTDQSGGHASASTRIVVQGCARRKSAHER